MNIIMKKEKKRLKIINSEKKADTSGQGGFVIIPHNPYYHQFVR